MYSKGEIIYNIIIIIRYINEQFSAKCSGVGLPLNHSVHVHLTRMLMVLQGYTWTS